MAQLDKAAADGANAAEVQGLKNRIQNSVTNLNQRKESSDKALKDCGSEHDNCQKANDAVQQMENSDLSGIKHEFEKVRKYAEQTEYHERQVRELQQYLEAGRSLVKEAERITAKGAPSPAEEAPPTQENINPSRS